MSICEIKRSAWISGRMIEVFALLLATQAAADPIQTNVQTDEIVVQGIRKLDDWRAVLVFRSDMPECRVITSTNDPEIDAIGCKTMVQCFTAMRPQFAATTNRGIAPHRRRQMRAAANREMDGCFKMTRRTMMVDLTNRRLGR